jgi:uncharacterized protein (TIRG00374 family)
VIWTPFETIGGASLKLWLRVFRRTLYFVLPPLLLYVIYTRIDLDQLGLVARGAHLHWVFVGLSLMVPVVVLGAARWYFLMRRYECAALPFLPSLVEYWKSLAVGMLAPGSLGSDAYRVVVLGRRNKLYLRAAFVIGVEKLAAIFSCALLVVVLYPLLGPNHLPASVAQGVDALYVLLLALAVFGAAFLMARRQDWILRMVEAINVQLATWVSHIAPISTAQENQGGLGGRNGLGFLFSTLSPRTTLPVVAISMAIYLISAVQSQVLFMAYGQEIPFLVNLFITPLLIFLYALPISFGGFGIREGAFILAYSAFGVPAETALIISVTGLMVNLLSYAIGAGLILLHRGQRSSPDTAT